MQIDQNPFSVHTLELSNPKVLIRLHQAESAKGKNVIVGEERHERRVLQNKTSRVVAKASMLGGQDKEKGADSMSIGLTGSNIGPTDLTGAKTGLTGAPVNLGIPPELRTRRGRASKSSWPNMRRRELPRNRRSHQARLRI